MKKENSRPDAIDDALSRIEFPGEDEQWIRGHLEEQHFVDRVMRAVGEARVRLSRARVWGAVALLNAAIIVVAVTNPFLVEDVLALRNDLSTFFYGFLSLTLAGCIVGLVLSFDLRGIEAFFHRLGKELGGDRVRNLFRHPRG